MALSSYRFEKLTLICFRGSANHTPVPAEATDGNA
ncbi:hypothetical protein EV128_1429 [Rhizobium azibense]|nr:hypothetical protein EV128_1429 [Rhizobium azibense]